MKEGETEIDKEDFFDLISEDQDEQIKKYLSSKTGDKAPKIWEWVNEDNDNSTVLHLSVYKKNRQITCELLNYCQINLKNDPEKLKSFVNKKNSQGVVALHFASFQGDLKIIQMLIEKGAKVDLITNRQLNVIHYASQGNNPNSLMYFYYYHFKDKIKITEADKGGSTPLHWAAFSSGEEVLDYLMYLCPELINTRDKQGYTPLHLAVLSQSAKIVLKLLQSGANIDIRDNKGMTPKELAKKKKFNKIYKLLDNSESCQFCAYRAPVKETKKSSTKIFIVIIFQIVTFLFLLLLVFPSFFYRKYNKLCFYLFISDFVMTIFFFFYYICLILSEPGELKNKQKLETLLQQEKDLRKFCPKCKVLKIKDSKHCVICEKCFEDFDHHCYWVNNCIGKHNYFMFIKFLFISLFQLIVITTISILWPIFFYKEEKKNSSCNDLIILTKYCEKVSLFEWFKNSQMIQVIFFVGFGLTSVFFLIPVFCLVILHIRVLCFNLRLKKNRSRSSTTVSLINKIDSDPLIN